MVDTFVCGLNAYFNLLTLSVCLKLWHVCCDCDKSEFRFHTFKVIAAKMSNINRIRRWTNVAISIILIFFVPILSRVHNNSSSYMSNYAAIIPTIKNHSKYLMKPHQFDVFVTLNQIKKNSAKWRRRERDRKKETKEKWQVEQHAKEFAAIFVHFHFSCFSFGRTCNIFHIARSCWMCSMKVSIFAVALVIQKRYRHIRKRKKRGNKTLPWYSKCSECSTVTKYA